MSKRFAPFQFDAPTARKEVGEFKQLLDSTQWLDEAKHIAPFFKTRRHLSAAVGFYNTYIQIPDMIAGELVLQGDYRCDLVSGQVSEKTLCLVEFEDATEYSLFDKSAAPYRSFSSRFEHGVSQIIDWCYKLDDMKSTIDCENIFGFREPEFVGLLVMGRSSTLSVPERHRFNWRGRGMNVRGHAIFTITYDDLYQQVHDRLNLG